MALQSPQDLPSQRDCRGLHRGSSLEREERSQSLPGHILRSEDRHHLAGQLLHLGRLPFFNIQGRQLQAGECGVKEDASVKQLVPHLQESEPPGFPVPEPRRDPGFHPAHSDVVEPAPVGAGGIPQSGKQGLGLLEAAGLGEAVHEILSQAVEETWLSLRIYQSLGPHGAW